MYDVYLFISVCRKLGILCVRFLPSFQDTERGSGRSRTFSERESVHRESDEVETNQLWVGNVTSEYTEQILREIFGRYGPVESVAIIASRSYAFIGFKDVRDATEAKKGLHGVVVRGRLPFQVEFAKTVRNLDVNFSQLPSFYNKVCIVFSLDQADTFL